MDLNSKSSKYLMYGILFVIIIIGAYHRHHDPKETFRWKFKGPVEKVNYDTHHYPSVIVDGHEYNLYDTIWDFNVYIQKGDTIIKMRDDMRIKVIRHNTHDTISFAERVQWGENPSHKTDSGYYNIFHL